MKSKITKLIAKHDELKKLQQINSQRRKSLYKIETHVYDRRIKLVREYIQRELEMDKIKQKIVGEK